MNAHDRHIPKGRTVGRVIATAVAGLCAGLSLAAPAHGQSEPARVAILYGTQTTYEDAAASLQAELKNRGYPCVSVPLPPASDKPGREKALEQLAAAEPTIIATAGSCSTTFALGRLSKTPVIFFRVPNARDAPFLKQAYPQADRVAGVTTDVSPEEQAAWIARLNPSVRKVAILHSSRTDRSVEAIRAAFADTSITVTTLSADKDAFPKAIDALNAEGCDGVLMIPDAKVYNAATIKRLLLWGIRRKKAVWTFSANVVKAGALAGIHSDGKDAVRQTAELIQAVADGTPPAGFGLQYPRRVHRSVNERTAGMIGVRFDEKVINSETAKFGVEP